MQTGLNYYSTEWTGPGAHLGLRRRFRFFRLVRTLVVPPKGQRTLPTLTGYVLIVLTIGMTMAAYQTSSNILFIAVSVLIASLIVSVILSCVNTTGVSWRLMTAPPFRADQQARVWIEVRNEKKSLPSYALAFMLEGAGVKRVIALRGPLDPGGVALLEAHTVFSRRGVHRIRIAAVRSSFPFGFLYKTMGGGNEILAVAWPARVSYRQLAPVGGVRQFSGQPLMKAGNGTEFFGLRDYRHGDSHREIHWKASARLQSLVVRQCAIEAQSGYVLHLRTSISLWPDEARFELFCSFVSTLAEDFFDRGVLLGARIDEEPHLRIGRRSEFNCFQDRLASLGRLGNDVPVPVLPGPAIVTFEPNSRGGIDAYIGGQRTATV